MSNDLSIKFPEDFKWGCATSAYQIEGAYLKDGKGASIWDAFTQIPGKIKNNDTGNEGIAHYEYYREDIALMKSQGFKVYRFSIAWPRVMPDGKTINEEGIKFYSDLIDELLTNDIEPWITLYHWDLPLALQMEEDGWLNRSMISYFLTYARLCFERFGDRVKHWITFNEPWVISVLGYGQGVFAPGRKSLSEPYLAAQNILLSHAYAVDVYRKEFAGQKGLIGITNNCDWREPLTNEPKDQQAAERALEFFLAWFADPIYKGDYPESMRDRVQDRLPEFSQEERDLLVGSSDFFGLNHYTTMYASDGQGRAPQNIKGNGGISEDQDVKLDRDEKWELTAMEWAVVPWGCRKLLEWVNNRYDSPDIYITENGFACEDELVNGEVDDSVTRLRYYSEYLKACHEAIQNGVQLKGYFAWSMFDNFEWAHGYGSRFGLNYVDYKSFKRIPKASAQWFSRVIRDNGF